MQRPSDMGQVTARAYSRFVSDCQLAIESEYRILIEKLWDQIPYDLHGFREYEWQSVRGSFFNFVGLMFENAENDKNEKPGFIFDASSFEKPKKKFYNFIDFDQIVESFEYLQRLWAVDVRVEIERDNVGLGNEFVKVSFSLVL